VRSALVVLCPHLPALPQQAFLHGEEAALWRAEESLRGAAALETVVGRHSDHLAELIFDAQDRARLLLGRVRVMFIMFSVMLPVMLPVMHVVLVARQEGPSSSSSRTPLCLQATHGRRVKHFIHVNEYVIHVDASSQSPSKLGKHEVGKVNVFITEVVVEVEQRHLGLGHVVCRCGGVGFRPSGLGFGREGLGLAGVGPYSRWRSSRWLGIW